MKRKLAYLFILVLCVCACTDFGVMNNFNFSKSIKKVQKP